MTRLTKITRAPQAAHAQPAPIVHLDAVPRAIAALPSDTLPDALLHRMADNGDVAMGLSAAQLANMAAEVLARRALERHDAALLCDTLKIEAIQAALLPCAKITGSAQHFAYTDTVVALLTDELATPRHRDITRHDIHKAFTQWDADPMARVWIETHRGKPILRGLQLRGTRT